MKNLLTLLLVFWPSLLAAQLTTVSGTVKDPSGLPYSLGTISASLVISGSPRFPSGFPYTPPSAPVGLDTNGHFVMTLADVTQILPSGGTWSFHVCSAVGTVQPGSPITAGPVCFDVTGITISGSTQDISTPLSSAAPRLTNVGGGAVSFPLNCPSQTAPCLNTSAAPSNGFGFANVGGNNGVPVIYGASGSVGQALAIWVNGTAAQTFLATPAANFNNTSPAAPTNGRNVQWQQAVGNPATISAALVGDGSTNCLSGQGTYISCGGVGLGAVNQFAIYNTTASVVGSPVLSISGSTLVSTDAFQIAQAGFPQITLLDTTDANATTFFSNANDVPAFNCAATSPSFNCANGIVMNGLSFDTVGNQSARVDFNSTTPAAPVNGRLVTWNRPSATNLSVSAALVGDGTSSHFLNGTGSYTPALPPVNTLASLPACSASTEGLRAVATNCSGSCFAGQACTVSGTQHCEVYCNGTSYAETGVAVPQQGGVLSGTGGTGSFVFNTSFVSRPACTVTPFDPAVLTQYTISLSSSNTTLVVNYLPTSQNPNFAFTCMGNPN